MGNLFLTLFILVGLLGFVAALGTIIWLNRLLPDEVTRKYSAGLILRCKFPFPSNWESSVDANDIPVFKRYRRIFLTWYVIAAFLIVSEILLWQGIG